MWSFLCEICATKPVLLPMWWQRQQWHWHSCSSPSALSDSTRLALLFLSKAIAWSGQSASLSQWVTFESYRLKSLVCNKCMCCVTHDISGTVLSSLTVASRGLWQFHQVGNHGERGGDYRLSEMKILPGKSIHICELFISDRRRKIGVLRVSPWIPTRTNWVVDWIFRFVIMWFSNLVTIGVIVCGRLQMKLLDSEQLAEFLCFVLCFFFLFFFKYNQIGEWKFGSTKDVLRCHDLIWSLLRFFCNTQKGVLNL